LADSGRNGVRHDVYERFVPWRSGPGTWFNEKPRHQGGASKNLRYLRRPSFSTTV
jgi:hypothetical protein